jgi:hypothetical protein
MKGTRDHHVKWNKPDTERQISHYLSYAESRPKQWHECKGELFCGEPGKQGVKGEDDEGRVNMIKVLYMCVWK